MLYHASVGQKSRSQHWQDRMRKARRCIRCGACRSCGLTKSMFWEEHAAQCRWVRRPRLLALGPNGGLGLRETLSEQHHESKRHCPGCRKKLRDADRARRHVTVTA